ncbi:MAG: hypothetical protein K2X27_25985 [Candidatus Obscuribacterales bacterium]|nr:hypothetical protein [Candidatus Obscuribacterales bacterium]
MIQKRKNLIALSCSFVLCCSANIGSAKESKSNDTKKMLYGSVDIINAACSAVGIKLSSGILPASIDTVKLGSTAYYSGVSKNDRVLSAKVENNFLNLLIERNGKKYMAKLDTTPQTRSRSLPAGTTFLDTQIKNNDVGVHVAMGLCGAWDANGIGADRWKTLAAELSAESPLYSAWSDWRETIRLKVKALSNYFENDKGAASVHLELAPDGRTLSATVYEDRERPEDTEVDKEASQKLIALLRKIQLPPYPTGSKTEEAHILIYVRKGLPPQLDTSSGHAPGPPPGARLRHRNRGMDPESGPAPLPELIDDPNKTPPHP